MAPCPVQFLGTIDTAAPSHKCLFLLSICPCTSLAHCSSRTLQALGHISSINSSHNTNSSITSVVKTPLSDLIHDLALPPPVDTEKPARGISATLYAWGDNDCNCLGVGMDPLASSSPDVIFTPQSISLGVMTRGLSSAERVSMVSCSSHHTVLCTSLGAVYTCGDGSDGQLGHGEMRSSVTFALVEWFAGIVPPPGKFEQIPFLPSLLPPHSSLGPPQSSPLSLLVLI